MWDCVLYLQKHSCKKNQCHGTVTTVLLFNDYSYDKGKMIRCTMCDEWYHVGLCVVPSKTQLQKKSMPWYCNNCIVV